MIGLETPPLRLKKPDDLVRNQENAVNNLKVDKKKRDFFIKTTIGGWLLAISFWLIANGQKPKAN